MQSDRELLKEARQRTPSVMRAIEALPTDRLVWMEAKACAVSFRLWADLARGMPPQKTLPSHASKAARIVEAILRERRRAEAKAAARAAAIKAAADQTETIAA